jgi:hypothetical protein
VKREAVAHLQAKLGLSERRACRIVGADRKMIRYRSRRAPDTEGRTRTDDLVLLLFFACSVRGFSRLPLRWMRLVKPPASSFFSISSDR